MADIEKKETAAPEKKAEKKPGKPKKQFFKRIAKFFRECKSEFKKIAWMGRKQLIHSSALVLICMLIIGIAVGLLDLGFDKGLSAIANLIG